MAEKTLSSLQQARVQNYGPLATRVLEFLSIMDSIVNRDKHPTITPADWAPLGELLDTERFHRVGNFGERVNWPQYSELLARWANSSWWKGYIWRISEVPGLVYLESEERSRTDAPVKDDGNYKTLDSIAVYEFDANNKIKGLSVYDQRPL